MYPSILAATVHELPISCTEWDGRVRETSWNGKRRRIRREARRNIYNRRQCHLLLQRLIRALSQERRHGVRRIPGRDDEPAGPLAPDEWTEEPVPRSADPPPPPSHLADPTVPREWVVKVHPQVEGLVRPAHDVRHFNSAGDSARREHFEGLRDAIAGHPPASCRCGGSAVVRRRRLRRHRAACQRTCHHPLPPLPPVVRRSSSLLALDILRRRAGAATPPRGVDDGRRVEEEVDVDDPGARTSSAGQWHWRMASVAFLSQSSRRGGGGRERRSE